MTTYKIRKLDLQDRQDIVELSAMLGWDYATEDLQTIFASGIAYGHEDEEGNLVACAASFPYGEELASIGMVMVHPEHRRKGLGLAATEKVIAELPNPQMPVMLVATAKGVPLYEHMGFVKVGTLHKFIAPQYVPNREFALEGHEFVPLTEALFETVVRLDAQAVGAERRAFLQARTAQASHGVLLRGADGAFVGYGLAVPGPENLVAGPIVAPDAERAAAVIDRLTRGHAGKVRIDVPSEQAELLPLLEACGFELVGQPPVMLLHAEELPKRNGTLYGIAAQAFG